MKNTTQSSSQLNDSLFSLKQQNLVPMYVLEDNLKANFNKIEQFIRRQHSINVDLDSRTGSSLVNIQEVDNKYAKSLVEMEKDILDKVKAEIESKVTSLLDRKLTKVMEKIVDYEATKTEKQQVFNLNIQQIERKLKYEIAQENQKYFVKEIAKIIKDIDKKIQTTITQKSFRTVNTPKKHNTHLTQDIQKEKEKQQTHSNQFHPGQQQSIGKIQQNFNKEVIQELKEKVEKLEEFRIQLQKKFVENFTTLKSSWKELGTQLLDNKKLLGKRIDELSMDVIQLKNKTEFTSLQKAEIPFLKESELPTLQKSQLLSLQESTDDSFKQKIMQKFNDLYTQLSSLTTKAEFQMITQRTRNTLARNSQQVASIRQQFQKNTEYFTFYMNNANTDDLKQSINRFKADILKDKEYMDSLFEDIIKRQGQKQQSIEDIVKSIGAIEVDNQNIEGKIKRITKNVELVSNKVKVLEDLNDIDAFKLKKIHDTLDHDLNFPNPQPTLSHLQKVNTSNAQTNRQLKKEIEQLKDQMFVILSERNMQFDQQDGIIELKNQIKRLHQRMERIKQDNEEAQLTRKPWVLMGSQKQSKELIRDSSRKKILQQPGRGGGYFSNNKSQKNMNLRMSPTPEDKFEVYEKYREKYLSDTLKLPQIVKEKLGGSEQILK